MDLSEIRSWFIEASGRYDLINTDGSDNGANKFINAGQRFLDRAIEHHQENAQVYRKTSAGSQILKFQDARVIQDVGIGDSDSFEWLIKYYPEDMRREYPQPYSDVERNQPKYYTPLYLRGSHTSSVDWDGLSIYMNNDTDWKTYNGILLMPIPDGEYHVTIIGKFYSEKLVVDGDSSFWSEMHDYILVMAAQRALEIFYRNTEGVKDWTFAIQTELTDIEQDFIEQRIQHIDQLRG